MIFSESQASMRSFLCKARSAEGLSSVSLALLSLSMLSLDAHPNLFVSKA